MKNHKIGPEFNSFMNEFLPYLYTNKTVYYAPAGKVMPSKFFLGWSWVASGQLMEQMKNFRPSKSYRSILMDRIREKLNEGPTPILTTEGKLVWRSITNTRFCGELKNKSELRRILKQVGVL